MAEKNVKRRRINGTHRWSDEENLQLVQEVAKAVKDKPESFEKPTSQIFYKKIRGKSAKLKSIDWIPMKNKMRHLKTSYTTALEWKKLNGAGLLASGDEKSVHKYIAKVCPKWNYLDQIFGQRRGGGHPSFILESESLESEDGDNDMEDDNFLGFNILEDVKVEILENSESSYETNPLHETIQELQESAPKTKNINTFCLLTSLQDRKLDLEVQKLDLEKVKARSEMDLKKLKLQQDFEIRKLQVESEERIKKYEIEIKYKTNIL